MTEGSSSSAVTPGFSPDAYRPSPYTLKPIGLKLYKPGITVHDDDVVLREPEVHLSVFNRKIATFLNGNLVSREYAEACLRTIASLEVVIRRQAIAAHASAPSMGVSSGRSVQGSRATPSAAGQDAVVYSSVDDEDDDEEGTVSDEEDEDNEGEDIESDSSGSELLGSEDTDDATLVNMTQKRPRKK